MEPGFGPHLEEKKQRDVMPRGIIEPMINFGELGHRCGVEHYSASKSTIKRSQHYLRLKGSRTLDFYPNHHAITIKNRVITVA